MTGKEVQAMKDDELKLEVGKLRAQLFDMRAKRSTDTVEDTSKFAKARHDIARMLGEQTSRNAKKK